MKETRVASRYAKSLLDLALQQGSLEKVNEDMKLVASTAKASKEFALFLKSPIIKTDKKRSILKAIFENKLSQLSLDFITIITTKKRESYLLAIAEAFINQYRRHKNILTAVVTSAVGLDDALRRKVMEIVKKSANAEVELIEKVDKKLIGGLILRVGDKQIDSSILRKLNDLKRNFSENPYISQY